MLQFLCTRWYNAFHEILHLFGPGGFLCGQPEGCELVHFCLFWQLISVTISRRSAAEGCADARTVPCKTLSARRRHGEHIVRAHVSDGAAVVRGRCTHARLLARQQQQARRQHQQEEGGERRRQPPTHCASKPSEARVALLVTVFAAISSDFRGNFSFACGALYAGKGRFLSEILRRCLRLRRAPDPSHVHLWYAPHGACRRRQPCRPTTM